MAKKSKTTKRPTATAAPTADDFERAHDLLRQRADALIVELAKRYLASKASELTAVLDAMDSLAEFQRIGPSGGPQQGTGA